MTKGNNSAPRKRRHTVIGDDEYEWVDEEMSTGSNDEGAASMEGFGVSGRWGDDDDVDIERSQAPKAWNWKCRTFFRLPDDCNNGSAVVVMVFLYPHS